MFRTKLLSEAQAHYAAGRELAASELTQVLGKLQESWLLLVLVVLLAFVTLFVLDPPPAKTLRVAAGIEGSAQFRLAQQFRSELNKQGVALILVPTQGSVANAALLESPNHPVDVALVQSGAVDVEEVAHAVSLGSLGYQPALLFYRTRATTGSVEGLMDLVSKRVAIGEVGSASHRIAQRLIDAEGLTGEPGTAFLSMTNEMAVQQMRDGGIDACFLMDGLDSGYIAALAAMPGVALAGVRRADAIAELVPELEKIIIPEGGLNMRVGVPRTTLQTLASTTDLLARADLHPALQYLLLEAAQKIVAGETMISRKNEFPSFKPSELHESEIATMYYAKGSPALNRYLPFWLAELVSRVTFSLVPTLLIVYPFFKRFTSLKTRACASRIRLLYARLCDLEHSLAANLSREGEPIAWVQELEAIENDAQGMKVAKSLASDYYSLRSAIDFVKSQSQTRASTPPGVK